MYRTYGLTYQSYYLMILPAMIFAMWAQAKVTSAFREFSRVRTYYGMTGYEAARRVLDAHGLRNVQIQMIQGNLTDHYDPRTNTISLSQDVYGAASVAAIGVAAHEAGHAVQYAEGYAPIKRRNAIIPITQIGSSLSWPLILIGLIMGVSSLISFGIILFSLVTLFQRLTLPVEFDASRRAVESLAMSGTVTDEELFGVRKVLTAAALTYVAALAVSMANLLRLLMMFGGRRRR
ncbi:MAG: zinc metallopeptidase [Oscillospiraceae bacterium]|nr:zinc metallopeptidase [Oscillospiraceae bacterium]